MSKLTKKQLKELAEAEERERLDALPSFEQAVLNFLVFFNENSKFLSNFHYVLERTENDVTSFSFCNDSYVISAINSNNDKDYVHREINYSYIECQSVIDEKLQEIKDTEAHIAILDKVKNTLTESEFTILKKRGLH